MEELEPKLFIVDLFNRVLGKPLAALLKLAGVEVRNPDRFLPDHVVMSLLVMAVLMLFFGLATRRLRPVPGRLQSFLEMLVGAFQGLIRDIIGEGGLKFLPVVGTVGIFIFASNLIGLFPGFMSPTSKLMTTLGCALVVFFYYHIQGMKAQGVLRYLKHFMGPIPALAPLLVPIELISHFSRAVSLSMRLFGNIFAEDVIILIVGAILPFLLPIPFMAVAIFTAVVQSFVFVLLSCIYIGGAVAHEQDH
jgi:F-type H+-transporting ATPase subunit a